MGHMKLMVEEGFWFVVETRDGTEIVSADLLRGWRGLTQAEVLESLRPFCLAEPTSYEVKHGFCGRYSAPGYLDRTDWVGPFGTWTEASDAAREAYGDEDDGENADES